jgi:deazaflavin-dependent oxidoreductase (nitroreductase family)
MPETSDFNEQDRQMVETYRANGGKIEGYDAPLLLLTTIGAKSGEPRTRPLAYLSEGGNIYVLAGNRGASTYPAWYHNLVAHPDVTVEVGTEKFEATAIVQDKAESERLGRIQVQRIPALANMAQQMTRDVPVVLLERKK